MAGSAQCYALNLNPIRLQKQIPVILLSVKPHLAEIAKAHRADACLAKPFNIEQLIGVIGKVLHGDGQYGTPVTDAD